MEPFIPHNLPLTVLDWERHVSRIAKANRELARYDGILESIPNSQELLAPLASREAVISSRIEGTRATLDDLMNYEANPESKEFENSDVKEVHNYKVALLNAISRIENDNFPISLRLIKEMHVSLMDGVRGGDRNPGNFRQIQNWIGPPGSTMETATYVPPPPNIIEDAIGNFELYIHFDEKDILVQLAVLHAQFEIIHPFLDGNGRLGRLLIPLILYDKKILSRPIFYLSSYFEYDRHSYYSGLNNISKDSNWNAWIEYFLDTIIHQSSDNYNVVKEIIALRKDMEVEVKELTKSPHIISTLNFIFSKPVFTSNEFTSKSDVPKSAANRILQVLSGKILNYKRGSGQKPGIYTFTKLIRITKGMD